MIRIWPYVDTGEPFWFFEGKVTSHSVCQTHNTELQSRKVLREGAMSHPALNPLQCMAGVPGPELDSASALCAVINAMQSQLPEGCLCHSLHNRDQQVSHTSAEVRASHSGGLFVFRHCLGMSCVYWHPNLLNYYFKNSKKPLQNTLIMKHQRF